MKNLAKRERGTVKLNVCKISAIFESIFNECETNCEVEAVSVLLTSFLEKECRIRMDKIVNG